MKISVSGLRFSYPGGVEALRGIDLSIDTGETVALVGENGAGKSTLARHLNGLLRPSGGRVDVGNEDATTARPAVLARHVGYVFQNPEDALFARTVGDEVSFGPKNLELSDEEVTRRVRAALGRVGLSDREDAHPYDLHASERKLLAIAAVVAMETAVLVLDEPTTGQDAPTTERIGHLVDELSREGRTIIVISHDIDFCADHCARAVVLSEGLLIADGPAEEVFRQRDVLSEASIEAPQLVRLSDRLGLEPHSSSVDRFLDIYARRKAAEGEDST